MGVGAWEGLVVGGLVGFGWGFQGGSVWLGVVFWVFRFCGASSLGVDCLMFSLGMASFLIGSFDILCSSVKLFEF